MVFILLAKLLLANTLWAATYVVTNTNDSGSGSLRQAIATANSTCQGGGDKVVFNIPSSSLTNGRALITLTSGRLIISCNGLKIDGATQTKFGGDTNRGELNPAEMTTLIAGVGFDGVSNSGDEVFLRPFVRPEIEIASQFASPDSTFVIIANEVALQNMAIWQSSLFSGQSMLVAAANNLVISDNLLGTNAYGQPQQIKGDSTSSSLVRLNMGSSNLVWHNYLAPTTNGAVRLWGIWVEDNMSINVSENYISGLISGVGVEVIKTVGGILRANYITGATTGQKGAIALAGRGGSGTSNILIENNTIKDTFAGLLTISDLTANASVREVTIRYNLISGTQNFGENGIWVGEISERVNISRNSVFGNKGIGIGLSGLHPVISKVTPNDGLKIPGENNMGMDYPIITSAKSVGTYLQMKGYVGKMPGQEAFAISYLEFYEADDDGNNNGPTTTELGSIIVPHGEGREYLGSCVTSLVTGDFDCTININRLLRRGGITASATDALGNTSEFGPSFKIGGSGRR